MYRFFSSSSSSSPEMHTTSYHQLPRNFKFLKVLGDGGFGTVVKCKRRDTGKIVAVKLPKHNRDLRMEASMLRSLMSHNLDMFNIIKFYDEILINERTGLVLEMLDISLQDYMLGLRGPMRLADIRTVIQQMATAFDALKRVGVIHTDIKIDNIMMVDHVRQPFRVKLIDFGLAIFKSNAKQDRFHQTPQYRAPEIWLGLPFSEAIDIWSLGCVMAVMVLGYVLFPARFGYGSLQSMVDLLGPPPAHLLNAGKNSGLYFKKTGSDQWRLKTPDEYWGGTYSTIDNRFYAFRSLDETKTMLLEKDNATEADERRECIELLKEMLKWEEEERITPSGILNHPFITKSYLNSSTSERPPSGVIMVQPAPPWNVIHLEETPYENSETSSQPDKAPATEMGTTSIHEDNVNDRKDSKKRKKNCFQRLYSWMKRKFSCRVDMERSL